MGPKHTPYYADIFLSRKVDPVIKYLSKKYQDNTIDFMMIFLKYVLAQAKISTCCLMI